VKYMPFSVANAALSSGSASVGSGGSVIATLPPDEALLLVFVWLIASLFVVALFSDRAEITG